VEGSRGKSGGKDPKAARKPAAAKRATARGKARAASSSKAKAPAKPAPSSKPVRKQPSTSKRPAKPKRAAKPKQAKKPRKDPSRDLWFRFSTRVRAVGYWVREKSQVAGRGLRSAGQWAADFWAKRSTGERIGVSAAGAVVVLALLLRFVPLPGVPCGVSAVKECAPEEQSFAFVPEDTLLYAHLTLDRGSEQYERAADAFGKLPDLRTILISEAAPALPTPSGATLDISSDVLPWAERDLAVTLLPGPGKSSLQSFTVGVSDRQGADAFIAKIAPAGKPTISKVGSDEISVYPGGFATAFAGDSLLFGDERAVRASLNAGSGEAPRLEGTPEEESTRGELPDARFAEVYLSRSGVQRLLVGRAGSAGQLDTFVDYGATRGVAAAAVAEDDGIEVQLVSALNPKLTKRSPSFFSELPRFEPSLADEAGSRAIGYIGIGDAGPTLADLIRSAGKSGGLAGSLQGLSARLGTEAGVDPLTQLLPALGGQAALVAEPTDGVPFASLIVDGVDEGAAEQTLAGLQKPLLRSIGTNGGSRVPAFRAEDVDGVQVQSVQISPTVDLSYAIFDDKLVISTDPAGIAQVRSGGADLADSKPYRRATDDLPDSVSALVFLNLDELFGQVTRTDLVEDPFFANLSVLFDKATSVGLAVDGEQDQTRTELFLAVD
jgi:Protein of unknown function (DUF3352)